MTAGAVLKLPRQSRRRGAIYILETTGAISEGGS